VEQPDGQSQIPESFLEHRQFFADPWVDRWIIPNPFISALFSPLRAIGAELGDFSFNKDPTNVAETCLNIALRKLNAGVRIGLDTVTFVATNPYWELATQLVPVFDEVSSRIRKVVGVGPKSQDATLAFHVTPGKSDFRTATASLVNKEKIGESLFYGVSLYKSDGALVIDKSQRHEGAAFVRIQRRFAGDALFAEVAAELYKAELAALNLLDIAEVP
jgi:hypothetical protein